MKTFEKMAAQGDLLLRKIKCLPNGVKPLNAENGVFVVAHSETGHNHVIDASQNVRWFAGENTEVTYLQVIEALDATETILRHLRGHDTHAPIVIPPGVFELRRQREHTPEGWRRVED
jgi:hypothetical protein